MNTPVVVCLVAMGLVICGIIAVVCVALRNTPVALDEEPRQVP